MSTNLRLSETQAARSDRRETEKRISTISDTLAVGPSSWARTTYITKGISEVNATVNRLARMRMEFVSRSARVAFSDDWGVSGSSEIGVNRLSFFFCNVCKMALAGPANIFTHNGTSGRANTARMVAKNAKADAAKQGNANGYSRQNGELKKGIVRAGCDRRPPSGCPMI